MTPWTHTILESARRIYASHGFAVVAVETHSTFGTPLQRRNGETRFHYVAFSTVADR